MEALRAHLMAAFEGKGMTSTVEHGALTLRVPVGRLEDVVSFLREDATCWFRQLIDICGVDYPERDPRFDVVYHFLSHKHNHRVRLIIEVGEETPVPSIVGYFRAAGWFEREVFDMYGVPFSNHTDLRRILTDYTFEGHPLRKDFPLVGHTEVYYSKEEERVAYRPVSLEQPFRDFDFESSWKGAKTVLVSEEEGE